MEEPKKKRGLKPGMTNNPHGRPPKDEATVPLGIRVPISIKPECEAAVRKVVARHEKKKSQKK